MNLITLTFEVASEDQAVFIEKIEAVKEYWDSKGFILSQFRDATNKSRFILMFLTEKSIDDFTDLIKSESRAKVMFEEIKQVAGHIVVSCMERVV
jgi:hypothetical protein